MKLTRTPFGSTKKQTRSGTANEAAALPTRQRRAFSGGLLPKAAVLALLLGLPLGASLLTAGEYRFIEIPVPVPSFAVGINDNGIVTGFYIDPVTGGWSSFVLDRGVLTTGISAPGATITALGPANSRGVESGNFGDETHQQAAFYDIRSGTYTPLPEIPGRPFSFCDGINDFGHASGVSYPSGDFVAGGVGLGTNWIWDGKDYSFFAVPDAVNGAVAGGINNRDQVTGYYVDSSGLPKGFVKDGPNFTTLNAPGALYTLAFGINNQGVVAGLYVDSDTSHHGYFWRDGQFTTVDTDISTSVGTLWYQANEQGDLAGLYYDGTHAPRAIFALRLDGDAH